VNIVASYGYVGVVLVREILPEACIFGQRKSYCAGVHWLVVWTGCLRATAGSRPQPIRGEADYGGNTHEDIMSIRTHIFEVCQVSIGDLYHILLERSLCRIQKTRNVGYPEDTLGRLSQRALNVLKKKGFLNEAQTDIFSQKQIVYWKIFGEFRMPIWCENIIGRKIERRVCKTC